MEHSASSVWRARRDSNSRLPGSQPSIPSLTVCFKRPRAECPLPLYQHLAQQCITQPGKNWADINRHIIPTLVSNRVPSCFCSRNPSLDTRRIAAQHKGTIYISLRSNHGPDSQNVRIRDGTNIIDFKGDQCASSS